MTERTVTRQLTGSGQTPERAAFLRMVWRWPTGILTVLGLGTVSIILNLIGPIELGRATDTVLGMIHGSQSATDLARILLLVLTVYALSGGAWILQNRAASKLIQVVGRDLRIEVAVKLDSLPVSFYDRTPRGELMSRITNDVDNVTQTLQQSLSQATNSVLLVAGVLSVMFYISPLLAAASLVTVLISAALSTLLKQRLKHLFSLQWLVTGELTALAEETYSGLPTLRALGAEKAKLAEFAERNSELARTARRSQFMASMIQPVVAALGGLNFLLVAVLGALQISQGVLSVGTVQAFLQYSRQYSGPLSQIVTLVNLLESGAASYGRIAALLATQVPPQGDFGQTLTGTGLLTLDHVRFAYEPTLPIIEDVSAEIPSGARVALVGATGAGKTTLASLIAGFYSPTAGTINLDGIPLNMLSRAQRAGVVGIVPQDAWFFTGTIAENIGYGGAASTRAQVETAAREVGADSFIRSLPAGYDTILDEGNQVLSKGGLQLISIARTHLSNPLVLILDEAMSAVDSRTEAYVQDAMSRIAEGRTTLVITHRLQTVRNNDLIIVLEDGRIAGQGSHETLLNSNNSYRSLYDKPQRGLGHERAQSGTAQRPSPARGSDSPCPGQRAAQS
jgi:ATP-binding cassette subfamily B multidrug efflux pump